MSLLHLYQLCVFCVLSLHILKVNVRIAFLEALQDVDTTLCLQLSLFFFLFTLFSKSTLLSHTCMCLPFVSPLTFFFSF
eukprot:m.76412 g.76412  ORF g.76412 m.76412 type:complete len:79 (-) comp12486_c0_seq2:33-269(-)